MTLLHYFSPITTSPGGRHDSAGVLSFPRHPFRCLNYLKARFRSGRIKGISTPSHPRRGLVDLVLCCLNLTVFSCPRHPLSNKAQKATQVRNFFLLTTRYTIGFLSPAPPLEVAE